jgi:hypothetical protein
MTPTMAQFDQARRNDSSLSGDVPGIFLKSEQRADIRVEFGIAKLEEEILFKLCAGNPFVFLPQVFRDGGDYALRV